MKTRTIGIVIVIMLLQVVLFCPFTVLAEPETFASADYETQTDFVYRQCIEKPVGLPAGLTLQ